MSNLLSIFYLVVITTATYLLSIAISNFYFHPLRKYPGPFWMKISRIPWVYYTFQGTLVARVKMLHEKHGNVVRIAPNELSYIAEQALVARYDVFLSIKKHLEKLSGVTDIYGHQPKGLRGLPKEVRKRRKGADVVNMISANDEVHHRMRRLQAPMFSVKALSAQEPLITKHVDTLILKLHERASSNATEVVDIVKWYSYTTFDILGELAFGTPFDCLRCDSFHVFLANIFLSVKDGALFRAADYYPWLIREIIYWMKPSCIGNAAKEEFAFAQHYTRMRALQGGAGCEDFMSRILEYKDKEGGMSTPEIESNLSLLVIAGSETTATFLSGITYHLLKNPPILSKLAHQIRKSFLTEEEITITSLQQLEYFSACLEEGLRTYPPVPSSLPRHTKLGGNIINGDLVPENTIVSVSHVAAYSHRENFTEPEKFIPERWLKGIEEMYPNDKKKVLQPFSMGPRNCIGMNLAYAETRLILAKVLWNFDMELQSDEGNWCDQKVFGFWEKAPLFVKLVRRSVGESSIN